MDDRFFNGIIGSRSRVCGYDLDALTPWHHVILSAIDSPVMVPDRQTETSDVQIFLKVATTHWPDIPDLAPTTLDRWWHWRMKRPKVLKREIGRLRAWLDAQLASPHLWVTDNKNKGKSLTCPGVLSMIVGLVSKGGIRLADAWNMRMSEARWYDVCLAEINGADVRIEYEGEADEIREKLAEVNEDDLVEAARKHMPPDKFRRWMKARKKNK